MRLAELAGGARCTGSARGWAKRLDALVVHWGAIVVCFAAICDRKYGAISVVHALSVLTWTQISYFGFTLLIGRAARRNDLRYILLWLRCNRDAPVTEGKPSSVGLREIRTV